MRAVHVIGYNGLSWVGHGPADIEAVRARLENPDMRLWVGPERENAAQAIADMWQARAKLADRLGRRDEAGWYAIPFAEAVELAGNGYKPAPPPAMPAGDVIKLAMEIFRATQAEIAELIGVTPGKISRAVNQVYGDLSHDQFERLRWWALRLNIREEFDNAFTADTSASGPRRPQLSLVAGTQQ